MSTASTTTIETTVTVVLGHLPGWFPRLVYRSTGPVPVTISADGRFLTLSMRGEQLVGAIVTPDGHAEPVVYLGGGLPVQPWTLDEGWQPVDMPRGVISEVVETDVLALSWQDGELVGCYGTVWLDRVVMMLTTHTQRKDLARCKDLGLSSRLIKPFSADEVCEVLSAALSGQSVVGEELFEFDPELTLTQLSHGRDDSRTILLVEDNPINQAVATKMLEKAGHRVTVAGNGQEAIEVMEGCEFDLILMDVQMPVMGGIEATQAIRAREARRSWALAGQWKSLPIIAMTAHAMAGDRQRCIEAGMDDYVTKPIKPADLFAAIARVSGDADLETIDPDLSLLEMSTRSSGVSVMDLDQTRQLLDGDEAALKQLVDIFFADFGSSLQKLKASAGAGDLPALAAIAHTVKGSVGVFGATPSLEAAEAVEHAAREGSIERAREALPGLLDALNQLGSALRRTVLARPGRPV